MIILQGKNLSKAYITTTIFNHIDFYIQEGEKIGLVGPNGAGKSTLFRCITGEEAFDEGQLMFISKCSMGYLEQMPDFAQGITLLDAVLEMFRDVFAIRDQMGRMEQAMAEVEGDMLEKLLAQYAQITHQYEEADGFSCESKAKGIIKGLGFRDEDMAREVFYFSGGEKTRVSLARLLVREPDLLLLDEPTNHLDLEALEWLENFLRNYKGTVLIISHDRYFLDQIASGIFELNHQTLKMYKGNYTRYLRLKAEQELSQMRAYEKQQQEIAETEEYIRKYKAGIKSKQARGRMKQLSRVERLENVKTNKSMTLNFQEVSSSGDVVLDVQNLSMAFTDKQLFAGLNLTIYKGEKVGLIGGNGVGKSTILKLITGELTAENGVIKLGSRVKVAYYDQEHRQLDPEKTIIDEIVYGYEVTLGEARDLLAQVLFFGEEVNKKIGDLSGGEKARVALLKIILDEPNLLLMDEPSNHLDITSKEIVEDFLQEFPGTVLMVSHDRYLLDAVTSRILVLENGCLSNYLGNYSYYKQKKMDLERLAREKAETETVKKKAPIAKRQTTDKPKINKSKVKKEIETLEAQIEAAEDRMAFLSEQLAIGENYQDEEKSRQLVGEFNQLEEEVPQLYNKWEELNHLLEEN